MPFKEAFLSSKVVPGFLLTTINCVSMKNATGTVTQFVKAEKITKVSRSQRCKRENYAHDMDYHDLCDYCNLVAGENRFLTSYVATFFCNYT